MPAALNWLLGLLITNPICMRLVQGGSRRHRHLWIRMGYLAVMIGVVSVALIGSVAAGQASVSHLQRRMRLGYSRAARIMDMLESDGIVGPNDGSNRREVLVPKDYFDEVDRQLR